jgi:hypothetical protein
MTQKGLPVNEPREPVFIGSDDSASLAEAIPAALAGRDFLMGIAGDRGGTVHAPVTPGKFGGLLDLWRDELFRRIDDGRTGLCEHLETDLAQPMIWIVYIPDLIRCRRCAADAARAVMGTSEDDLCDACGILVVGPRMTTISGEITAQIRKGRVSGPIIIHGGACPPCAEKDKEATAEAMGPGRRIEKREQ